MAERQSYNPTNNPTKETQKESVTFASLFDILRIITISPENIKQNQYKSINKNGNTEFYY